MYNQVGEGLPHFHSSIAFQRGHGLGGILGKFIKTLIPLVKKPVVKRTLKRIGKTAFETGVSAVHDSLKTPDSKFKDNLKKHARANLQKLTSPVKRKAPRTKTKSVVGTSALKKRKLDVFDF